MQAIAHLSIGTLLVIVGVVLALGFADAEFLWFTGRPLGVVLVIVGALDLVQGAREQRKQASGD